MIKFHKWFLPESLKQLSKDEQIKAKFLVVNASSTVIWGPVMVAIVAMIGAPKTALAIFFGFVFSMASVFTLKYTAHIRNSSLIFIIGLYLMYIAVSILNNGPYFGGLIWMLMLPLLALNSMGIRFGIIALIASLCLLISLKIAENMGVQFINETPLDKHQFISYLSMLVVAPLIFAVAAAYYGLSRTALFKERELGEVKTKFISNVSHELRTPLNGIIGLVEVLKHEDVPSHIQQYIQTIDYSSRHLLNLVNDILDLTETQSDQISFVESVYPFKFNVQNIISNLSPLAHGKALQLTYLINDDLPESLFGDGKRIDQLLLNFIGNSLKFTHRGGVDLMIDFVMHENCVIELLFTIKDSGIGIPEKDIPRLFEAFYQVDDSSTRANQGTGLGLSICQQIIQSLNGEVSIKSTVGLGTEFKFNIFQKLVSQKGKIESKGDKQSIKADKKKILRSGSMLIVEDNLVNQLVLKRMLEHHSHQVTIANNGKEAVDLVKHSNFDIIFMDGQMPILDGFDATRIIKNDLNITTPIIAVTAGVTKTDVEKCQQAGMDAILSKPILARELQKLIYQWMP